MEKFLTVYANVVNIIHTKNEFVLDFILNMSGQSDSNSNIVSRIVTSPEHTKRLKDLLSKMLKEYEKKFGEIKLESNK